MGRIKKDILARETDQQQVSFFVGVGGGGFHGSMDAGSRHDLIRRWEVAPREGQGAGDKATDLSSSHHRLVVLCSLKIFRRRALPAPGGGL